MLRREVVRRLGRRHWLVVAAVCCALVVRGCGLDVPSTKLEGLASLLSTAVQRSVDPKQIAWGPSRGLLSDLFRGRDCLFLATQRASHESGGEGSAGAPPKDLFRARLRVSPEGQVISVQDVSNLTRTPVGDDRGLLMTNHTAVFATAAFNAVQAITVLDVRGVRPHNRPSQWFDRLLFRLSAMHATGTPSGIDRADLILETPPKAVKYRLSGDWLEVDQGDPRRNFRYHVARGVLEGASHADAQGVVLRPQKHGHKPFILWAVDLVRDYVGPEPIAWLEQLVFGARDTVKRATYSIFASSESGELSTTPLEPPSDPEPDSEAPTWPPAPIASLWSHPEPGEGEWAPVQLSWLKSLPAVDGEPPPPYFYRSFIRPDTKRPYVHVHLIAMDMRQLELGMQAGYEDPKPLVGPPGSGHIPHDPSIVRRVVATFNGAFKTTHGEYGMMVDRRVLIPPVEQGATLVVTRDRRVGMGNWPTTDAIPEDVVSFRQNLDPLVENGVPNPTGRHVWGWQLAGESVLTDRTAICRTKEGNLLYAWGQEINGPTLARGLSQAGCDYAMHLDMNPKHCGFVFTDVVDVAKRTMTLKLAHKDMTINPYRYVLWSPKDFFYLTLRSTQAQALGNLNWEPSQGAQPDPRWLPALHSATLVMGQLSVRLSRLAQGRLRFAMTAGSKEPERGSGLRLNAAPGTLEKSILALDLGHATSASEFGLAFDGQVGQPLRGEQATLLLSGGELSLVLPGQTVKLDPGVDAVQLPLLARGGQILERAHERGARRLRGALCLTKDGEILTAAVEHDSSDPLALALIRLGCVDVLELDRGSHHPAVVHRGPRSMPAGGVFETTLLWGVNRPMAPRTFAWKPPGSRTATTPTGYDRGTKPRE